MIAETRRTEDRLVGPVTSRSEQSIAAGSQHESEDVWRIMIAYDALAAGQRAFQLFSRLDQEHVEGVHFQVQFWRFDLLSDPAWREFAAVDLTKADMIIIAASRKSDLPMHVQTWLSKCLAGRKTNDAAILALFGTEEEMDGAESPRLQFLQSIARAAGLAFFAPLQHEADATAPSVYWRAPTLTITHPASDALGRAPLGRHWGTND